MGRAVEIVQPAEPVAAPVLEILLLGSVVVRRHGLPVVLARSRKLRALLSILAVEGRPVSRRWLCELLWDRTSDPRAELRWHLSKLRQIVEEPARPRVLSDEDEIGIDLQGCVVDALEVLTVEQGNPPSPERLMELAALFRGQFLGELELSGTQAELWLMAQRRRFAACRIGILKHLVASLASGSEDVEPHLERWLDLAPFDVDAHQLLLAHLVCRGRIAEADKHVAAAERLFADEGVSAAVLREAWDGIRSRRAPASVVTAEISEAPTPVPELQIPVEGAPSAASQRSALAVMPFISGGEHAVEQGIADGLTQDIITRLAKLRSLSIIARGSVYAMAELGISSATAGRRLGVDYVASGTLHWDAGRLRVQIELVEVRSARIVWAEVCDAPAADLLEALDELGNRIVAALTGEVEQAERNRAVLRPPASLDAWGAHHRGLWHMYRFTREDNAQAQHFFDRAVTLDPTFSRAHAGLSFTHWQNAFQNWSDPVVETERAYAAAAQSLLADEQDPAAHWAMGRALWLRQQHEQAVLALRESVDLSPNFALGHYSLAFVESQTGDPMEAIKASDKSRALSPYDPLMFGMLGSRAMAHLRLGQFEEAAVWATQAASRPNAHINILGLAALCLSLAGRIAEGQAVATTIRVTQLGYGIDDFLRAFHFSPDKAKLLRAAAVRVSMA